MAVLSDPVADFLTRFKNATRAGLESFEAPHSRLKVEIARILQEEGYVWGYEVDSSEKFPKVIVRPRYTESGSPVLTDLKRVSKPGRRQYVGSSDIPRVLSGLGISILSTSKGVMTGLQAKKERVGGEILAYVW